MEVKATIEIALSIPAILKSIHKIILCQPVLILLNEPLKLSA
jgi:hypothetical protein